MFGLAEPAAAQAGGTLNFVGWSAAVDQVKAQISAFERATPFPSRREARGRRADRVERDRGAGAEHRTGEIGRDRREDLLVAGFADVTEQMRREAARGIGALGLDLHDFYGLLQRDTLGVADRL